MKQRKEGEQRKMGGVGGGEKRKGKIGEKKTNRGEEEKKIEREKIEEKRYREGKKCKFPAKNPLAYDLMLS